MNVLVLVGSAFILLASCSHSQDDDFDANVFMEKFGYLDNTPGHQHSEVQISSGVRQYQRFHGLKETGRLDRQTIRMMRKPRCGVPDIGKLPLERPSMLALHGQGHHGNRTTPLAYHAPGHKWKKKKLTYKFVNFTKKLRKGDQRRAIANALQKWADVTPLRFVETKGDADILIKFVRGYHGDGKKMAFTGPGGTLAHAYLPGPVSIAGDLHFDDDEKWTVHAKGKTDLERVAVHEFGHSLGLGHSSNSKAIMAPVYRGYDNNYRLHADDINGIQSLYGKAQKLVLDLPSPSTARQSQLPRTTRPHTQDKNSNNCNIRFDAIEQIQDGRVLAFVGRYMYTVTRKGIANRVRTTKIFPRAPKNPGAVVYDQYKKYLYFFKGSRYWRYSNFQLDSGYPKLLPVVFHKVKSGMQWKDGGIYLFRGPDFMRWSEDLTGYSAGYPRRTDSYWRKMPEEISAIFNARDGSVYAFAGISYYRFDSTPHLKPGYPKDMRPLWLNCQPSKLRPSQSPADDDLSFLPPSVDKQ